MGKLIALEPDVHFHKISQDNINHYGLEKRVELLNQNAMKFSLTHNIDLLLLTSDPKNTFPNLNASTPK